MRIFLVRHGQSKSNIDKKVHHKIADHAMPLSEEGERQATEAGEFLTTILERRDGSCLGRLWVSPYHRTRQTADLIEKALIRKFPHGFLSGRREHINLVEQQFGLFDGYEDEERGEHFPREHAHFQKCVEQEGEFWARMPLGESRFDVATRVHASFGTFKRDEEKHRIKDLVIVSHGSTIRAFIMQWLHLPYEWFEKEPTPKNCSIRLIEDDKDHGFIFEGFEKPKK